MHMQFWDGQSVKIETEIFRGEFVWFVLQVNMSQHKHAVRLDCLSGVRTGRCVVSDDHPPNKSCEIYGWCPVEQDALPVYVVVSL